METTSAIRKVQPPIRRNTRCGSSPAQSAGMCANGAVTHGFLKHSFLPFEGYNLKNREQAEKEYFRSVTNICRLYELTEPDVSVLQFPANMVSAHRQVTAEMEMKKGFGCYIMQDETHMATMTTAKPFGTGFTLFYIPIRPFQRLGEKPELQTLADLFTLTCAYLYQVTKVDYYREYCYVRNNYDTIEEWLNDETEDQDYFNVQMAEIHELKTFGDLFLPRLKSKFSMSDYVQCLGFYRESACFNPEYADLFEEFAKLITDYPQRSVYDAIPKDLYGHDEDGSIYPDQYLSFYWGGSDNLNEVFFDMINNELQESGAQVLPVSLQWFDEPQDREHHCFDYEARLFALLPQLNYLLYNYDYANEHHQ